MIKKYRVVLTNGDKWVVKATSEQQAKSAAIVNCPGLKMFGVHINKIEIVENLVEKI